MSKLENLIYNKIVFFLNPKKNCDKFFNKLVEIPNEDRFKESKRLEISKNKNGVSYDSPYEKKIINDLDKCCFVKKIKTQSLVIEYKTSKLAKKTKKYFPDIQVLLEDGRFVLIEVKPFKEMVNKHVLMKNEALRKYCRKNRYGYAIIDHDYHSFEDIKKEKVPISIQKKFISFVKNKKEVSFEECDKFKKEYNIDDYQICYIIYKNQKHLKYQQHLIMYKKKETK